MEQVSIKNALASLKEFVDTYDQQTGYESYLTDTFVFDILYGIGVAIDKDKYHGPKGYEKFQQNLRGLLVKNDLIKKTNSEKISDGRKEGFYKLSTFNGDKVVAMWLEDGWRICGSSQIYSDQEISMQFIWPVDLNL